MAVLDSSIRVAQIVIPPAIQYFGKAKEREAKLTETKKELAQTKAQVEVLVIKNHESKAQVEVLEKRNQELEDFKKLVMVLAVVAVVVFVGMALTSERMALS